MDNQKIVGNLVRQIVATEPTGIGRLDDALRDLGKAIEKTEDGIKSVKVNLRHAVLDGQKGVLEHVVSDLYDMDANMGFVIDWATRTLQAAKTARIIAKDNLAGA